MKLETEGKLRIYTCSHQLPALLGCPPGSTSGHADNVTAPFARMSMARSPRQFWLLVSWSWVPMLNASECLAYQGQTSLVQIQATFWCPQASQTCLYISICMYMLRSMAMLRKVFRRRAPCSLVPSEVSGGQRAGGDFGECSRVL